MILVTGGAGYIGSHVVKELLTNDKEVLVIDNLSTGHREVIDVLHTFAGQTGSGRLQFVIGDTGDRHLLCSLMRDKYVEAVVHLAAYSQVGESMQEPGKYFDNNVAKAICLLDSMVSCGVKHIVFSSTAAVYGEPEVTPITENAKLDPANVYGTSKLMVEQILQWYSKIYSISYVSLRYFNASGADESGLLGEWHIPETHLIPIVLQYALGQRNQLIIYGDDYDTADGTCIRDYIHVTDLAKAHVLAIEALSDSMGSRIFNLGNGCGYSVKEIISCTEKIVGRSIPYRIGPRRQGDPAVLIASSDRIRKELGWTPRYSELSDIVRTAWKWHSTHNNRSE